MTGLSPTHAPSPLNLPKSKPTTTTTTQRAPLLLRRSRKPLRRIVRKTQTLPTDPGSRGKRSGPATPLLRWKFDEADGAEKNAGKGVREEKRGEKERDAGAQAKPVSARRIGAGIWHLQVKELAGAAGTAPVGVGFEHAFGHLHAPLLCNFNATRHHEEYNDELPSPVSVSSSRNSVSNRVSNKILPSDGFRNHPIEGATKWDHGMPRASDEAYRFYGQLKFLEDHQSSAVSVVSSLQADLEQARARITELEDERQLAKRKLDHFLRKLAEEKASWRSREHDKVRAIMDDMKDNLTRERKNRQRMEILNSKLVGDLKEAKLSAKRYLQDYEKERKTRELMEEVCDELAKEIGDEKAEIEYLKSESKKIRDEVEEERRMLQMAEVWREERVQMKLVDAKITLENKYMQLTKLEADLVAVLSTQSGSSPNEVDIREAASLIEAIKSIDIHELKEFSYEPPRSSDDIFAIFEELQPAEETNERDVEECFEYSPDSCPSKIHMVSPEINGNEKCMKGYLDGSVCRSEDIENESGWETMSPGEEHNSSDSNDESILSFNGICVDSSMSISGTEWEDSAENCNIGSEMVELYSATKKQSKKKTSSIARLWKSSGSSKGEECKMMASEVTNRRLSNCTLSSDIGSGELVISPRSGAQWSSPDPLNPHIARGMKGCIEWPKGMQKQSLKSKLLEARMESQRFQLRHVLKQKS